MPTPAFNPQASYSMPSFDPSASYEAGSAPSVDLSNKAGQGTYNMWDTAGQIHPVPYSLVPVLHGQGFQFDTNADPSGMTPAQRFTKDEAADPNRTGGTSLSMAPAGARWAAPLEPQSRQESLQRLGEAETNAPLPVRIATGVAKGGATLVRPAIDAMNLGMGDRGNTPQEQNSMMEGRTPAETAAKVGTIGAALVPGAVAAPVATALGLAGGNAAGYGAGKVADALGADPKLSAVVGDVAGLAGGVAAGAGLPRFMPEAVRNGTLPSAWDFVNNRLHPKELLTGDIHAPIPGTDVTPAARYESMKAMGIQPSAAEATNSRVMSAAEKVNQNSLTSARTYADARAANLKALNEYTQDALDTMSPEGPEAGGAAVQQGLLKKHADLKVAATEAYKELDAQVGNQPLEGAAGLREMARKILDANAPYYKLHPELEPTKAMAIVRDLAEAKGAPRSAPKVVPGFGPSPVAPEVAPPRVPTYSELHRLRSDLLDFNNTNPDLVKNQANGWIAQLARAADDAITSSESALTPSQVETFRNANEAWKFMKEKFDNPSHPLYDAVRTQTPSKLVNGISPRPEIARMLQGMLSREEMGPIQRGIAENLLRTTKEGGYNFKTFQGQWNKLKPEYREALFSPEQREQLEGIGNAGTVLHEDANPSGSAKLGQGIAEGAEALRSLSNPNAHELAGNVLYHAGHYGLGRLMNSPAFVDWLMRGRGFAPIEEVGTGPAAPAMNRMMPAAVASGAITSGWDFEKNRPKE